MVGLRGSPAGARHRAGPAPGLSPDGGHLARTFRVGDVWVITGAETQEAGEGFGTVNLPAGSSNQAPARVVAVTDDGRIVPTWAGNQVLWGPPGNEQLISMDETAPQQVVIGNTAAGLLVDAGAYDVTDGTGGNPYLARLSSDGTLTRVADVPTHDVLDARGPWLAWVPQGTAGGETSGTDHLQVQHIDGPDRETLAAPDGWLFVARSPQPASWSSFPDTSSPGGTFVPLDRDHGP